MATTPEPGIHRGVSFDEYCSWPCFHASAAKFMERSPASYLRALDHPPTEAMMTGHAAHVAVFEPKRYDREFIVKPKFDHRKKKEKAESLAFDAQAEKDGKRVISSANAVMAVNIEKALRANSVAKAIMDRGESEVSLVWHDSNTDVLCKARMDWLTPHIIADLKTTKDASPEGFRGEIARYGYDVQAAFYREGLATLTGAKPLPFIILAVEKTGQYLNCVHTIGPWTLLAGQSKFKRALYVYATCMATGKWPGYPEKVETEMKQWVLRNELGDEVQL